jgi:hypothetical protein
MSFESGFFCHGRKSRMSDRKRWPSFLVIIEEEGSLFSKNGVLYQKSNEHFREFIFVLNLPSLFNRQLETNQREIPERYFLVG